MLEIANLSVSYGDLQILHDISLEVKQNEIVALVGANGAGKSTTLKSISRLLEPKSGSIHFLGQDIVGIQPHKIIDLGIIHVPEGRRLFAEMTVRENLILGALSKRARPKRNESLDKVFGLFPRLSERQKQLAGTLSGGEQQMLAIGRGLMALPKLIMFDEPSLGLAPILVADTFKIIKQIRDEGVTILLVEQNTAHTLAISDRGYVLENGRIILSGKGSDLLNDDHVKQAYLGI